MSRRFVAEQETDHEMTFTPEQVAAESPATGDPRLFPPKRVARYAVVGAGNSVFGYCCYAAFVALYKHLLPAAYRPLIVDFASVSATLIGVTVSFLSYKFLVFRTRGNYLREWFRCLLVYGAATLPGLFILPILTKGLAHWEALRNLSPYLAGAIVMGGTAACTYLAHTKFSFAAGRRDAPALSHVAAARDSAA